MSRFKTEIQPVELVDGGKLYLIDRALVPALRHVPVDLLPPLLAALDRELRYRHRAWMRADRRTAAWRKKWMGQAIPLLDQGKRYANIGKILEGRPGGLGSADRIARTLAQVVVRKKKPVRGRRRT